MENLLNGIKNVSLQEILKEMFKAIKYNKDYSFLYSVGFTDENGNFSERIETFKVTSDSMQHYINYAKTSLKQESA